VPILKLSDINDKALKFEEAGLGKGVVFVTARQHPGETVSSFAAEGIVRKLCDGSEESRQLLAKFVFFVVPMVNVDGVVYGNFRCDLSGNDLNRAWANPCKHLNPTVYHTRKLI
jgi:murein tripeptide amidase MpaA